MNNLFYFLMSFIIALFFMMLGLIAVMIPWSGGIRDYLIKFIMENSLAISLFGFSFIVIGLAIVINILLMSRRRYYYIKSSEVSVDKALIHQYLSIYWKQLFPSQDIPFRLAVKKNKIYINVDFPRMGIGEQPQLLEKIQTDLQNLFIQILGYKDEFYLNATFQA